MASHSTESSAERPLILVVEDELKIARVVIDYLRTAEFRTHWDQLGRDAIGTARMKQPSLVLLDLNLPDMDGLSVCRQMRQFTTTPIIMLTARIEEIDRVMGLDAGADDYVCKPFSPSELLARIRASLRRAHWPADEPIISGLVMDESRFAASLDGQPLRLTPVEFRLLNTLLRSPRRVFTRNQLLDRIYDDARDVADRAIDGHVRNLRIKLRSVRTGADFIHSIYGIGYKFELKASGTAESVTAGPLSSAYSPMD